MLLAALFTLLPLKVCSILEAYTGMEPSYARSMHFHVALRQGDKDLQPMVYMTKSPDKTLDAIHKPSFCVLHGGHFCNRTISWVEFGQAADDITTVVITRLDGLAFPLDTHALPSSYAMSVSLSDLRDEVTLQVRGQYRHIMLQFGDEPSSDPASSFNNALFIFAGGLDPDISARLPNEILLFKAGVHHIPGDGILQLPAGVNTVVLERGSWVEGRINVTRADEGSVSILGHGVMEGSRFIYHGGNFADHMRFVEIQYDRPLLWDGPMLVHPQGHALFVPPNSVVRCFRMLGWLYNEDGIWLGSNTTLSDSFVRTNDDSIRFYAGALDGFLNRPAPPKQRSSNIVVKDVVVRQSFNGAALQLGWENTGIVNSSVDGVDIIGAEWYWDMSTANATLRANNAVVNLRPPEYDLPMAEHHLNLTISNVRVDGKVGRFIGIGLEGTTVSSSSLRGLQVTNVTIHQPLQWLRTQSGSSTLGSNYLVANAPDTLSDVNFTDICLTGLPVLKDSDWNLLSQTSLSPLYAHTSHAACSSDQRSIVMQRDFLV